MTSLIVVHTNKKQGVFGRNRIADSADVWDIARSVMIVGSVPGSNERYLSQEKSNYGPLSQTVLFNIGEKGAEFTGFSDKHDADYVGMRDYERRQGEVTRMSDLPIEPEIGDVYKVSGKTVFFDGCWNEIASAE